MTHLYWKFAVIGINKFVSCKPFIYLPFFLRGSLIRYNLFFEEDLAKRQTSNSYTKTQVQFYKQLTISKHLNTHLWNCLSVKIWMHPGEWNVKAAMTFEISRCITYINFVYMDYNLSDQPLQPHKSDQSAASTFETFLATCLSQSTFAVVKSRGQGRGAGG